MYFKPVLESPHWLYYCMCQEFSVSVAPLFCEGLSCHGSISKEYCMIVKGTSCNLLSLKYTLFKLRETYFSIQSPLKSAPVVNNILPKLLKKSKCMYFIYEKTFEGSARYCYRVAVHYQNLSDPFIHPCRPTIPPRHSKLLKCYWGMLSNYQCWY